METITVAGGGIAGLSLGIALRRLGVPVHVHEATNYPRHKVCGEFMAGEGGRVLQRLGLDTLVGEMRPLETTCWRNWRGELYKARLPEAALGLSRHRLDDALATEFRRLGGELSVNSRLQGAGTVPGQVLATGRRLDTKSKWIGLKCHVRGLKLAADLELHLGKGCYAGASPVEDGWVNVCGLFPLDKSLSQNRRALLPAYLKRHGLSQLAAAIEAAELDEDSCCGVNGLNFSRETAPRFRETASRFSEPLRIGDHGALIPPFTGNGMSLAIESAVEAAPQLAEWSQGKRDWDSTVRQAHLQMRHLKRRVKRANLLHPWIYHPLGQKMLWPLARGGMLPFRTFFRLLH